MSNDDRTRRGGRDESQAKPGKGIGQPAGVPGKRTLTMSLPPRPASTRTAASQAPVEQEPDPAATRLSCGFLGVVVSNFRIMIEPSSLEVHKSGSVTGTIWMALDGQPFPEASWNDFALIVLGWWCHTVSDAVSIRGSEGEMRFMDGPFLVSMLVETEDCLRLVARTGSGREVAACLSSIEDVRRELVAAAKIVLEFCDLHGMANDDVRVLRSGAAALQAGAST